MTGYIDNSPYARNGCEVILYVRQNNGPSNTTKTHYTYNEYERGRCAGVTFDPAKLTEQDMSHVLQAFASTPIWKLETQTYPGRPIEPVCYFSLFIYGNRRAWRTDAPGGGQTCEMGTAAPIQCTIGSPMTIEHPPALAGTVTSRKTAAVNIQCSATTSVGISILNSSLKLYSGNNALDSVLSVGANGQVQTRLTADPTASIDLISMIDASSVNVGEYSGSAIVTVSWD